MNPETLLRPTRVMALLILLVAALGGATYLVRPSAARPGAGKDAGPALRAGTPTATPVENPHGELKTECEACHTARSWKIMRKPMAFDHASTGFPLIGRHRNAACRDCHASLVFAQVASSCADCHTDVHRGSKGLNCQDCHSPQRWSERAQSADEHARAGFPLRGGHALVECARCHVGEGESHQARISAACVSCHSADYAATTSPNHQAAGYSTRCESCHDPARTTWGGAGFDHALTGFPLVGAHRLAACQSCHAGGRFRGTPRDCYSCHQGDYAGTTNPNHPSAGFSTTCESCHDPSRPSWAGAGFNHSLTGFALAGAHALATCASCHAGGRYRGTPRDCYSCHQADYDRTQIPNHLASGFSTQCVTCHSTTAWSPSSWDHDSQFFRINTGKHRGKWSNCTICHPNSASFADFTCFNCHAHDQIKMDDKHQNRPGYRYDSQACYSCHRQV